MLLSHFLSNLNALSSKEKKSVTVQIHTVWTPHKKCTYVATDPGPLFFHEGELLLLFQLSLNDTVLGYNLGHFLLGLFPLLIIVNDFLEHLLPLLTHSLHCFLANNKK